MEEKKTTDDRMALPLSIPFRFLNVAGAFFLGTIPLEGLVTVGKNFSGFAHSGFWIALVVLGSVAVSAVSFTYLYFFLKVCWWSMEMNRQGISGVAWNGKQIFLPWEKILGAGKRFPYLPFAELEIQGRHRYVEIPLFVEKKEDLLLAIKTFAPPGHALTFLLSKA